MKVAVVGPICKDVNTIKGKSTELPGGVTYYSGRTFESLGVETIVFGSCGSEDVEWASGFGFDFIHTGSNGTIKFKNIYPDIKNPDLRMQRIGTPNNITPEDIRLNSLTGLDYFIYGPLSYDNIFASAIKEFSGALRNTRTQTVLLPQGMIRYTEGGGIVKRNPENVLRAIPYLDYIFLDDEELKFISGEDIVEYGARSLQDMGVKNVVVTLGRDGSQLFLGSDTVYKIKAFKPRKIVDTTGAGDTFMAGYFSGKDAYIDPVEQGRFAAMAATIGLEEKGVFKKSRKYVLDRLMKEA
ncbi:MAG: hypothetical protein IH845_01795 [Nanoarchaeota archaeon]|nr:hypothetical protein [Nanoarchaeota archaeon]